jgi:hypothetical protein
MSAIEQLKVAKGGCVVSAGQKKGSTFGILTEDYLRKVVKRNPGDEHLQNYARAFCALRDSMPGATLAESAAQAAQSTSDVPEPCMPKRTAVKTTPWRTAARISGAAPCVARSLAAVC